MFKLALRPSHDNPDQDNFDAGSNTLSASPTLIQPSTPSHASPSAAQDDKDEQRRTSFLRRRFSSMWTQKTENATDEDVRGPLGLRLLFASPEPMIEIIFVHGLRGGSVKTWQKGRDQRLFWPQHWLPSEPEFRNASIHSFGYEADWKSSQPSVLSIHDFGQALYEEIRSSSILRRNPKVDLDRPGMVSGLPLTRCIRIEPDRPRGTFHGRTRHQEGIQIARFLFAFFLCILIMCDVRHTS